jgi:hypothetical protein
MLFDDMIGRVRARRQRRPIQLQSESEVGDDLCSRGVYRNRQLEPK